MKKLYFLLFTILISAASFGQVIITELADPNNNAGARYVELYVVGPSSVDFTGLDLVRWTNANTTISTNRVDLASLGTLQPDTYVIIAANGTTFQSVYGFAPDISAGTGGPADSNGDDQIAIVNDADDSIVDIFGVPGEDGNNTCHEFEGGRAERIAASTSPLTVYDESQWNLWTDNDIPGGCTNSLNSPQDAPGIFDPGAWIGDASTCGISFGTVTYTCTSNTLGDDNDTVVINIPYTGSEAGVVVSSNTGVVDGDDPSTDTDGVITIIGQMEGEAWDLILSGGNCDGTMASGTVPSAECDPQPTVCFDLSNGVEQFESVSVDTNSDVDEWTYDSMTGAYNMNGFCGGGCAETSDTWLIFGPLDVSGIPDLSISFTATEGFSGTDLNVQYTDDYSSGCPSTSTWTSAGLITASGEGNIDLSGASGTAVFIGIQYFNDDSSFSDWTLSDVTIGSFVGCPTLGSRPTSSCVTCDLVFNTEVINCVTNTAGVDNDQVTIDISYTGVDMNVTSVTSTTAMVGGDSPALDENGTITLSGISEGDMWDVTINGGGCDGTTFSGTVPSTNCDPATIIINEIHADPASGLDGDANGDGTRDFSDDEFIEFYNVDANSIDISDYTIETGGTLRHTFAAGTILDTGDYIVVFGGGMVNTRANTNVTASSGALSLGNSGTTIVLKDALGVVVTEYTYGSEGGNDQSLARDPDFTGPFVQHLSIAANPVRFSPGAGNALSTDGFDRNSFSIYPNPTNTGEVTISTLNSTPINVVVYDILGKQVQSETISNNTLNVSNLKSGIYLLRLEQDGATTTKKLVIE